MVAEEGGLPGGGGVATRTICAEQPSMDRGFGVTAHTSIRRAGKNAPRMTRFTTQSRMLPLQREHRAMVKVCQSPCAIVASKASVAKLGDVCRHKCWGALGVAGLATVGGEVVEGLVGVAVGASEGLPSGALLVGGEAKAGVALMVEEGRVDGGGLEGGGGVASVAICAENAGMNIRLFMTTDASIGGGGELLGGGNAGMASTTTHHFMRPIQGKISRMLQGRDLHHRVMPIMTSQTGVSKICPMFCHEIWLFGRMADNTRGRFLGKVGVVAMATGTGEIRFDGVLGEDKRELSMVKFRHRLRCQVIICPFMFAVASDAIAGKL